MPESDSQSWRISPLAVAGQGLAFVAANLRTLAMWSVAPLAFGMLFHMLTPSGPPAEGGGHSPAVLLALGLLLLWVRVPLEVRLYRKAVLSQPPATLYGQQLLEPGTWRYLGTYFKIMTAFLLASVLPCAVATGLLLSTGVAGQLQELPALEKTLVPVLAMALACAAVYVWLAPRAVLLFADAALGGSLTFFSKSPAMLAAVRARWRIAAAMLLIWCPQYALMAASLLGDSLGWWDNPAVALAFSTIHYLFGFVTALVSMAAGAAVYSRLQGRPVPAPVPVPDPLEDA